MMNVTEISFIIKDTMVGLLRIIGHIITKIIKVCLFSVTVALIWFTLVYLAGVCDILFGTNFLDKMDQEIQYRKE